MGRNRDNNSFYYFLKNNENVLLKMKFNLGQLKAKKYVCSDSELPKINSEIKDLERSIEYYKNLCKMSIVN